MDYAEFKKIYGISNHDLLREIFRNNKDMMRIKKEKTAINNLEKIFRAVFRIAYRKGFKSMTMRDLSEKTGISLGALYAYFPGKDKLLSIIQSHGWTILKQDLEEILGMYDDPTEKLREVIKAHIFLSELFRPWFYFTFMEARNIKPLEFEAVKSMEEYTQKVLADILVSGEKQGIFKSEDHELTASIIKAMQQEWYLKRWKYRKLKVSVDRFADHVIRMVEAFCLA